METALTPKQKQLLDFLTEFRERHGYAPSQHEIAQHFGFRSLGTVQNYLSRLQRQGLLQKSWNARRGIRLKLLPSVSPLPAARAQFLPLAGRVAAGRPIEAIQSHDTIEVPVSMIKGRHEHFVLKVEGDSMIEDGILDGDLVVIRKQSAAENGQTVVALINNEATIKRYQQVGDRIELHPANPRYKPIVVDLEDPDSPPDFRIEGVLAGVMRIS